MAFLSALYRQAIANILGQPSLSFQSLRVYSSVKNGSQVCHACHCTIKTIFSITYLAQLRWLQSNNPCYVKFLSLTKEWFFFFANSFK